MFNILVTTDATTEVITTQRTTEAGTTLPPTTGLEIENYLERIKTVFNIYLLSVATLSLLCNEMFWMVFKTFSDNDCKVRFNIYLVLVACCKKTTV